MQVALQHCFPAIFVTWENKQCSIATHGLLPFLVCFLPFLLWPSSLSHPHKFSQQYSAAGAENALINWTGPTSLWPKHLGLFPYWAPAVGDVQPGHWSWLNAGHICLSSPTCASISRVSCCLTYLERCMIFCIPMLLKLLWIFRQKILLNLILR